MDKLRPAKHPFAEEFARDERKGLESAWETKRVARNALLAERNYKDARWPCATKPDVCELLKKADKLEDAGKLSEAVILYQQALGLEPEHLELRQYIDVLNNRANAEAAARKKEQRQKEFAERLGGGAHAASLQVTSLINGPAFPVRCKAMQGGAKPGPKQYSEELKAQMAEQEAAREAARAREAELDRREVRYAQLLQAEDNYKQHVGGGNNKLALNVEMKQRMLEVKQERMRKYEMERAADPTHMPQGPLLGVGEADARRAAAELRQRNLDWHREQARVAVAAAKPWEDAQQSGASHAALHGAQHRPPPLRVGSGRHQHPPYSPAYQAQPLHSPQPQHQHYSDMALPEGYKGASGRGSGYPGGGYSGGGYAEGGYGHGRPASASVVGRSGGYAGPGWGGVGLGPPQHHGSGGQGQQRAQSAARARPAHKNAPYGVDKRVQAIDPDKVRARQEVFYAKHHKPPTPQRLGNKHVTPSNYKRPVDRFGLQSPERLVLGKR